MTTDKDRAEFEAAMQDVPYSQDKFARRTDGSYLYSSAELAFTAWQRGKAARSRSGAVPAGHALVPMRMTSSMDDAYYNAGDLGESYAAMLRAAPEPPQGDELHPATRGLVSRFAAAMADKLLAAQRKYGYSDDWMRDDWIDECRAKLLEHVAKGDPRDVANYCAFLWHHGASTAADTPRSGDAPRDYLQTGAPKRIYLGTGCDEPECAGTCYFQPGFEATWCADRLGPYDIEYVRGDLVAPPAGAIAVAWMYTDAAGRTHYTASKTRSDATPLYPHPSAFRGAPADARDGGVTMANYNEGTVTVPVKELREVLDGNIAAAEDALPQAGNSIDFIEARGGADADDASDRIAYHLFYAMFAAEKLRPLLPQIPADSAMGAGGGK